MWNFEYSEELAEAVRKLDDMEVGMLLYIFNRNNNKCSRHDLTPDTLKETLETVRQETSEEPVNCQINFIRRHDSIPIGYWGNQTGKKRMVCFTINGMNFGGSGDTAEEALEKVGMVSSMSSLPKYFSLADNVISILEREA